MTKDDDTPAMADPETDTGTQLTGKLLIAMPDMGDERFTRSLVYVCAHSPEGAMGLIVNKLAQDLEFGDLLEQLDIPPTNADNAIRVHIGGPVEVGRGFVLHTRDYDSDGTTLEVDDNIAMTATLDILEDISSGAGPEKCLLALGYAGWAPGQLEAELQRNGWLICDAPPGLVFGADNDAKWVAALGVLGVDPLLLSSTGGTA